MQKNTFLTKLSLSNMKLDDTLQNIAALTKMLQVNKSLTHLDLSRNKLNASCIIEGLQHNTVLVNLNLSKTSVSVTDRSFSTMLQINKSLTHLDISNNIQISDSGAHCIFQCLQHNTVLENLNLSKTGISATDPDTARSLFKMLQINNSLTHLDLSNNRLSDSGARCVFEGLQCNTVLKNLNLSKTGVSATDPDTARSLFKMLQINNSLTHLDLSMNDQLTNQIAQCIFKALKHNCTLVSLNLSRTSITFADQDTASSFTEMLKINKSLTHLDLSHMLRAHEASKMISCVFNGLQHNTALHHLNLSGGPDITDTDAKQIAKVLKLNRSLLTLNLARDFHSGDKGIKVLLESLMFNSTLQTLQIYYIDSSTLSTFIKKRAAKKLPPIDIHRTVQERIFQGSMEPWKYSNGGHGTT